MRVAFAAPSAGSENIFFSIVIDLTNDFAILGSPCDCTEWYLQDFILPISAGAVLFLAWSARRSDHMLSILQVQKRPQLRIATQNDIPSFPAITSVGTAMLHKLFPVEMHITGAAMSRAGIELNVINEVRR
jgi:hypothetical protein